MSINEMEIKIAQLQEWEPMIKEAEAEAEAEAIKAEMLAQDTEELQAGRFIVRWTSVISNRFDSTAFKRALPDVYKSFAKPSTSRRFSIS